MQFDELAVMLSAVGWRSAKVIRSTVFVPGDDREVTVQVMSDVAGTGTACLVRIGPSEHRYDGPAHATRLTMHTHDAGEVAAVLQALGYLPQVTA